MRPEVWAIIPARGGSKGIPRKNIKLIAGKPMLAYSIEQAKQSRYITRVFVNTEDAEIARIAKKYGAEVFDRPPELAEDMSTDHEVFYHQMKDAQEKNELPEAVVQLRPNLPCRTVEDIDKGITILLENPECDSVRAIIKSAKHPFKMWVVKGEYIEPFIPEHLHGIKDATDQPHQKFPQAFIHTAAVDVMRPSTILEKKSMTGKVVRYFIMNPENSVNIDNMLDFRVAEQVLLQRQKSQNV